MKKSRIHPFDLTLDILGIIAILALFAIPTIFYERLPDSLPRHFGSDGLPDAFAGKGVIWVFPILGFFMYLIIRFISTLPELINLPFKVNPSESESQKKKYGRMIRILNVAVIFTFLFLTFNTIEIGLGNQTKLPTGFKSITLFLLFGIPSIFIIPDWLKSRKFKS
ncbi:DUF1648 domain-containing protein [Algoriphagus sp. NF]|uniref:DUF1648 domain-containing protein n=1 Tax=Algoriphagus marincola TaxID=264027 RepID=A0ABS7N5C0_9BACT|nr:MULTISPECIES: DUF1648 domain-containing protein [Algoriphagus]MBY5951156.1 DUF1648 domain-containing protein [Algoriphagus marincola]MCR9084187.1 DUF1648 domain-containing protein [Cyclobacteriaceae bacterium]MDE0560474.1 DUF1648 domain-containing protein [Algoriphagus sp. NF]